jgi:hypothetical protein
VGLSPGGGVPFGSRVEQSRKVADGVHHGLWGCWGMTMRITSVVSLTSDLRLITATLMQLRRSFIMVRLLVCSAQLFVFDVTSRRLAVASLTVMLLLSHSGLQECRQRAHTTQRRRRLRQPPPPTPTPLLPRPPSSSAAIYTYAAGTALIQTAASASP